VARLYLRPLLIIHARIITIWGNSRRVHRFRSISRKLTISCRIRCSIYTTGLASDKGDLRVLISRSCVPQTIYSSIGLFHRVVLSSGSALSPWASVHDPNDIRAKIGEQMGCSTEGDEDIADCLRGVPLKTLMDVQLPEIR